MMNDSLCLYHHWKMSKNGNVVNVVLSVEVKVQSVKPAILLNQCGHVWKHVSVTHRGVPSPNLSVSPYLGLGRSRFRSVSVSVNLDLGSLGETLGLGQSRSRQSRRDSRSRFLGVNISQVR